VKEFTMTSFVHTDHSEAHAGVQRAEALLDVIGGAYKRATSRHVIAFLLIASVSSALVVADALVSNWDEGKLLAAWVVLCGALFAGIALYADLLFAGARRVAAFFRAGAQRRAAARADARFLATAQSDPRVMQELRAALMRNKSEGDAVDAIVPAEGLMSKLTGANEVPSLYVALARMKSGHFH
jgi:hypothetical protein